MSLKDLAFKAAEQIAEEERKIDLLALQEDQDLCCEDVTPSSFQELALPDPLHPVMWKGGHLWVKLEAGGYIDFSTLPSSVMLPDFHKMQTLNAVASLSVKSCLSIDKWEEWDLCENDIISELLSGISLDAYDDLGIAALRRWNRGGGCFAELGAAPSKEWRQAALIALAQVLLADCAGDEKPLPYVAVAPLRLRPLLCESPEHELCAPYGSLTPRGSVFGQNEYGIAVSVALEKVHRYLIMLLRLLN